jgi:3-oxoacyl-(acyl-carrier-protein) synthase
MDPSFNLNLTEKPKTQIKHILKNSLGFGGINCSVILSQERLANDAL